MTVEPTSIDAAAEATAPRDWTRAGVVFACTIGNIFSVTPVARVTFGVFLLPMAHEFDWPRAKLSGALTLQAIVSAVLYPFVGGIADVVGARRMVVWGSLAFGLSVAALAFSAPQMLWFYGLFALIGLTGGLPSTMLLNRVVSEWFDKTRGAMLGVAAGLGNGIGTSIMPPIAAGLMVMVGWRGAYLGLAALVLVIAFPILASMLREVGRGSAKAAATPTEALTGLSLRQAMATASFWMTLGATAVGAGCMGAAASRIIPIMIDHGLGLAVGSAVVSTYALVCGVGQVLIGGLLDRTRSPKVIAPLFAASVLGLVLLQRGMTVPAVLGAGVLLGLGLGAEYAALPYLISRYFGLKHFGAIAGVMYSTAFLAQGITPFLMDLDFDAHGSYRLALRIVEVALLGCAGVLALMKLYPVGRWNGAA